MISLIRRGGTLVSLARRYWLSPKGLRNSSSRMSPGWIGGSFLRGLASPAEVSDEDWADIEQSCTPDRDRPEPGAGTPPAGGSSRSLQMLQHLIPSKHVRRVGPI